MTIDISSLTPAEGAGRMTPEKLLSLPWRYFGKRVLLGAAFLDEAARLGEYNPDWRKILVRKQEDLDMRLSDSCVLGLTSREGSYLEAQHRLGFNWTGYGEQRNIPFELGFITCVSMCDGPEPCDPAAIAYSADPDREPGVSANAALGKAWIWYCTVTAA